MLSRHVEDLALEFISKGNWYFNFCGNRISLSKQNKMLITLLIQNDMLAKNELERAIHKGLCAEGRMSYLWTRRNSMNRPDHSNAPYAIGYALMHRAITYEEALLMKFDHGETLESYIWSAYGLLDWAVAEFGKPYVADMFESAKFHYDVDSCCVHS